MGEGKSVRRMLRKWLPRLLKAVFWALLMGGEVLIILYLAGLNQYVTAFFPVGEAFFFGFMVVYVLFEVAIQILSDTIFKYALSVTRALVSMVYLVFVTNGGTITTTIPPEFLPLGSVTIQFTLEFRAILAALLLLSLLSIAKNVIQAIHFLAERAEHPITLAKIP